MSEATVHLPESRPGAAAHRLLGDDLLARLVARGDQGAFSVVFERHHQGIYRYCLSILREPEDASDALQNTMVKAMQGLAGGDREIALKPWLYRIAHNESISLLRRRRPQEEIDEGGTATLGGDAHEDAASRARLTELVADLQQLPERQRGALVMRELSGLGYEEIGAAFGVSQGAAKQTVYEARTALHDFSEGRRMACEQVRRAISDGDGRVVRGRKLRAHLRDCPTCRDFEAVLAARKADLAALAPPLPAAAAAGLLQSLLGGGSGGSGGGGLLAGGGALGAAQAAGVVAVVMATGAGAFGAATGAIGPGDLKPEKKLEQRAPAKLVPSPPPTVDEAALRRKMERRAEARRASSRRRRAEDAKAARAKAGGSEGGSSSDEGGSGESAKQGEEASLESGPDSDPGGLGLRKTGHEVSDTVQRHTGVTLPRPRVRRPDLPVSRPKVDVPSVIDAADLPKLPSTG